MAEWISLSVLVIIIVLIPIYSSADPTAVCQNVLVSNSTNPSVNGDYTKTTEICSGYFVFEHQTPRVHSYIYHQNTFWIVDKSYCSGMDLDLVLAQTGDSGFSVEDPTLVSSTWWERRPGDSWIENVHMKLTCQDGVQSDYWSQFQKPHMTMIWAVVTIVPVAVLTAIVIVYYRLHKQKRSRPRERMLNQHSLQNLSTFPHPHHRSQQESITESEDNSTTDHIADPPLIELPYTAHPHPTVHLPRYDELNFDNPPSYDQHYQSGQHPA